MPVPEPFDLEPDEELSRPTVIPVVVTPEGETMLDDGRPLGESADVPVVLDIVSETIVPGAPPPLTAAEIPRPRPVGSSLTGGTAGARCGLANRAAADVDGATGATAGIVGTGASTAAAAATS